MEPIDSKLDLFQSLKDEESNDNEGASQKSVSESELAEDLKFESRSDDETNHQEAGSSSPDKEVKKKVEKQNRKEVEEEEREKML